MLNRNLIRENASLIFAVLAYTLVIVAVSPWGEYPLNDDIYYSWMAKRLAETHRVVVEPDVNASTVGQTWMGAVVIWLFGFSHLNMRILTLLLGAGLVVLVERILKLAKVSSVMRAIACLLLIFNPLFLNLTTTFMTEVYGMAAGFLGVWLWYRDRRRLEEQNSPFYLSWKTALISSFLMGMTFWIRQFSALVYPALLGALLFSAWRNRDWQKLRNSVARLGASFLIFLICLKSYFIWVKASGNMRVGFELFLRDLGHFGFDALALDSTAFWSLMALFFAPLLLCFPVRRLRNSTALWICMALILLGLMKFYPGGFPIKSNLLSLSGVGPKFITDYPGKVYPEGFHKLPAWYSLAWDTFRFVLMIFAFYVMFGVLVRSSRKLFSSAFLLRQEILLFALLYTFGVGLVTFETFKYACLDRYDFIPFMGMLIAMIIAIEPFFVPWNRVRFAGVALLIIPMGIFTVGGVHDYFRFYDAKWSLVYDAMQMGAKPSEIDGGYDISGWFERTEKLPYGTAGRRHEWRYRIEDDPINQPGYELLKVIPVADQWLIQDPPLRLTRKFSNERYPQQPTVAE